MIFFSKLLFNSLRSSRAYAMFYYFLCSIPFFNVRFLAKLHSLCLEFVFSSSIYNHDDLNNVKISFYPTLPGCSIILRLILCSAHHETSFANEMYIYIYILLLLLLLFERANRKLEMCVWRGLFWLCDHFDL